MPRFILFMRGNADSESGRAPTPEEVGQMAAYNVNLASAGILLGGEGILPSSRDAHRVTFSSDAVSKPPSISTGPFPANELISGFWIIRVKDAEEAVTWAQKCPIKQDGAMIEIRRIADIADIEGAMAQGN